METIEHVIDALGRALAEARNEESDVAYDTVSNCREVLIKVRHKLYEVI